MSLQEKLAALVAEQHRAQAQALLMAAPKLRATDCLQAVLQRAGVEAVSELQFTGSAITARVQALGDERAVARALVTAGVPFERFQVRGLTSVHYDCEVDSYTVTVLVLPLVEERVAA